MAPAASDRSRPAHGQGASLMELRDEIVESQKARVDLLKWKIIIVATLGAVALGFESSTPPATLPTDSAAANAPPFSHDYLLCLIPLICLYVDILCSHLNLRMMVIGRYLQYTAATHDSGAPVLEYEQFVERARNLTKALVKVGKQRRRLQRAEEKAKQPGGTFSVFSFAFNAFAFEDLALHLSSIILSSFVFLWGAPAIPTQLLGYSLPGFAVGWPPRHVGGRYFMMAGAAGFALSALAYWRYRRRLHALRGLVEELKAEHAAGPPPAVAQSLRPDSWWFGDAGD
jgi:hypothetical protein